jgi:spore coat polysaccharide biosynthesis protein SpsF
VKKSSRKLVAAIACRNNGSRLYGKPLQNLDIKNQITILDNIIACLNSINIIDEIVLGISTGIDNLIFEEYAIKNQLKYIFGDEKDVLSRLIACGEKVGASDIFRVTSESPFLYYDEVEKLWEHFIQANLDAIFMDEIIDGCGFEIISLDALIRSHKLGESRHRSEFCSLYIRENNIDFKIEKLKPPVELIRKDLRLTVDNPEDLVVCRSIYQHFKDFAPIIPLLEVVQYLDSQPDLKKLVSPFVEDGYQTMNK